MSAEAASFDAKLVQRGAHLASIGNCVSCHTAEGGKPLAGGLAMRTPFGTIYSTNITPDPETGIGRWSQAAFGRAMQEGVDRQGRHLYPAFPYDHFTQVTDEDNQALFAFLMTRAPVRARIPQNELSFPYNMRMLIAGWKLLFLNEGAYQPDPSRTPEWNRGAYIVEGLAHCGACHTPRNALGAEKTEEAYSGGHIEGWYAYAIDSASPAPIPWDAESLFLYLRRGWNELHGVSRGPMAPVTANLASVPEEDVRAIAVYVTSLIGEPTAERRQKAETLLSEITTSQPQRFPASSDSQAPPNVEASNISTAAIIYAGACATCHESGRPLPYGGLHLALSTGIHAPDARNVINVILAGLPPAEGERSPLMPGFAGAMTDEQLVPLMEYLRKRFTDQPTWTGLSELVRERRSGEASFRSEASDGEQISPPP
jgi:mono/diheme cytochrome c family protein